MKKYALAVMTLLCSTFTVQADIINGFSQEKQMLKRKINETVELLNNYNSEKTQKKFDKQLKQLRKEYEIVSTKYTQTAQLLAEIQFIDPELFAQVANLTNADGTLTHVYIRYVSRSSEEFTYYTNNHFKAKAYTSVRQSPDNPNVCMSLYGTNTITITIGIGCDEKMVLGHEFAHVLYIVPNLKEYSYFMKYRNKKVNTTCHGHSPNDPSYAFLKSVEDRFAFKYAEFNIKNEVPLNQRMASQSAIQ
jgi:hypothetical protein